MSKPVISVENLSKAYRIGVKDEIPDTLVRAMTSVIRSPFKNLQRLRRLDTFTGGPNGTESDDTLWALKDVSFDVQEGEVVGIIGRNGAGKSTLLKVLSRITEPTSGRVVIRGRVSSLLEVGTGFHPELTGRDNIYMNGTILGMTKREIDRKFDEIVDFSGVEKFLDTPVKRYSSGMQVRLAFAVAAHLEPEILIIDEVLAVGDAEFQKKCLGKMQDVAEGGRTVLFVSHNMSALQRLCTRAVLIEDGQVKLEAEVKEVVTHYLSASDHVQKSTPLDTWNLKNRNNPFYTSVNINSVELPGTVVIESGSSLVIRLRGNSDGKKLTGFRAGVHIRASDDTHLLTTSTAFDGIDAITVDGFVELTCKINQLPLIPGAYFLDVGCQAEGARLDFLERVAKIEITYQNSEFAITPTQRNHGYVFASSSWCVR